MISNKHILVTGGAGSIGSELVRTLVTDNEVFFFDINETELFNLYEELKQKGFNIHGKVGDVRNYDEFEMFESNPPDIIFHAAALKHVTPSAWSPEDYVSTNIVGTLNVLKFAQRYGGKVINISTDKVVNANSIMGATKKVAEIAVRDAGQISVRFGNVMGSRGSVLEIWQRQIDKGEPLTVTDPTMTRYMMTLPEAVQLIIKAAEIGELGQILVMDMGAKVNILELAKDILQKSGKDTKIHVKLIGIRPGETMTETLMTVEEKERSRRVENFWVI